jgi:hypothetical protein
VYSRELKDQVLMFAASGWTYVRTFVLYDKQTESMWYPYENYKPNSTALVSIAGPLADTVLQEIPSELTTWKAWSTKHPGTKFMKP